jgi:aldehyde oxidoreductase
VSRTAAHTDDFNVIFVKIPSERTHGSAAARRSSVLQTCGHNAIHEACGVPHLFLPHADKVKADGSPAERRGSDASPKYFLGSEFEDELEDIRNNPI